MFHQRHNHRPKRRAGRTLGFSLVELLAVVAILLLLLSLLFPLLAEGRKRADLARCAANLRQLYALCIGFAATNNSLLPQGLSENPQQLSARANYTNFALVNEFMKTNGYPRDLWYCPSFPNARALMTAWGDPNYYKTAGGTGTPGEFPIGYTYAGNPTQGSIWKYKVPPPRTLQDLMDEKACLAWDYCKAPRPSPLKGGDVAVWSYFPHFGENRPSACQYLMGGGHVRRKPVDELELRYNYIHPGELYW